MMRAPILIVLPALLFAAGCGDTNDGEDARSAEGEILEGSVSDDMLALDRVPAVAPSPATQRGDGANASPSAGANTQAEAADNDATTAPPAEAAAAADEAEGADAP